MKRALFAALAFLACNTLPVGFDQLRNRVPAASADTLRPERLASYAHHEALGGADFLYLGRDAQYQSHVIVRFTIPDTIAVDSVTGCELVLHPVDSTAMPVVCRPCSAAWSEGGADWVMADSGVRWAVPGGDYRHVDLCSGTFQGGDSLVMSFDYAGLDSATRADLSNNGIILFPTDTGFLSIHAGGTASTAPHLRVSYRSGSKVVYTDNGDAALVDTMPLGAIPGELFVGSALPFRTYLWFNVDSLPPEATIARAELSFKPEIRYHRLDSLPLAIHRLTQPFESYGEEARFDDPIATFMYVPAVDTDSLVRVDIRTLIQFWTTSPDSNFGLLLTANPEWCRTFRFRVPGSGQYAPRLEVQYVLPPEDRFR